MNKRKDIKFRQMYERHSKKIFIESARAFYRLSHKCFAYFPRASYHFRWRQWYKCCWLYRWRDIDLDIDVDVDAWEEEAKQLRRD